METQHDPLCDQNHTTRQACNRLLGVTASASLIVSAPLPRSRSTPTPAASRSSVNTEGSAKSSHQSGPPLSRDDVVSTMPAVPARALAPPGAMPEPSPWASLAWEDTAAAVGATTARPGPARPALTGVRPSPAQRRSVLPIVGALLAAAAALVLLARRR